MSGIGIIMNPYSRANLKKPDRVHHLGFIVGDKGSCHSTETLDEVRDLAHEFKERCVEVLGLSGGDGTNHRTLTTFMEVYGETPLPKIALLRGGTMNNLANQLNIRGTPEKILSNLIMRYHEGIPFDEVKINMIRVNDAYGFIFGMGVINRFIDEFQNVDEKPSPARAAWILTKAVSSVVVNGRFANKLCERFDCKLTIDGVVQPFRNYSMIFAGTATNFGFGFRPLYRGDTVEGQFQAVAISATGRQLFATFPSALLAKPSKSDSSLDHMCQQMTLEFEKPMPFTVDGDIPEEPTKRIEVSAGPLITCIVP